MHETFCIAVVISATVSFVTSPNAMDTKFNLDFARFYQLFSETCSCGVWLLVDLCHIFLLPIARHINLQEVTVTFLIITFVI